MESISARIAEHNKKFKAISIDDDDKTLPDLIFMRDPRFSCFHYF